MQHLPTPMMVIDAAVVRRNLDRLGGYTAPHGLRVRPHTKTHKSRVLAAQQLAAGSPGLTVAKVGEAECFADLCDDLLLAYPAVDPSRCQRLAVLANRASVTVAIDSAVAAEALGSAARQQHVRIGILVDIDVGFGRTGVQSPEDALALAKRVDDTEGLTLRGLMCYPGHVWNPAGQQEPALRSISARLAETLVLFQRDGLNAEIVSGGSTPTAYQSHLIPELTEIRPGTYIFNDMNTVHGGFCTLDDCAARIVATVVSDAVPDQVVIDAGTKTLTSDRCLPAPDSGHGCVVEYPEAKLTRLSEEHGQIDVSRCRRRPRLGERVTVIPNHICPCVNLQDAAWLIHPGGELERLVIDARGKLS